MGKIASLRHQPSPLWTPGRLALLSVLLAALALRLYGLNWDQGQYLHPDERYVIQYVMQGRIHFDWPPDLPTLLNPETSGLNPRSDDPATGHYREFAYGALPLLVTDGAAEVLTWLTDRDWHASDRVYLLGRTFSALLDALTVAIVYLIGRAAFSARVGLFAAALAALAPMSIQLAHFLTTDSWLTFFVALCLLFSINAGDTGLHRWFAAAGAGFGLAMATKGSVFTLAAIIVAAVVVDVFRRRQLGGSWISSGAAGIERLALAGVCSIVAFGAFEPFALIAPEPFLRSLETQANIVRGVFDVPFTRQYVGTTPVIYQLEQLIRWGFGPAAGILMLAGLPIAAWRLWKRPNAGTVLVLGWIAIYSMVIAIPETKFLRYLAPLVPVLAVVGGVALEAGWRFIARRWNLRLATGITAATLCCAALWTAAFSSVYAGENPRIAASRWIFANVPNGSALSGELWDDGLPKEFGPGLTASDRQFESVGFDMYRDYPNQSDFTVLGETLARESLTYPVSQALVEGSYKQARDVLVGISSVLGDLPQTDRDQLALLLERAANQISGSAALRDGARGAASGLRAGGESAVQSLTVFGDSIVGTETDVASEVLYQTLARTDYYILSSNRVSSAVPHLPWRYPVQIKFYELLRSEALGFHLVAEFTNYPRLGPIEFADDSADESFLNYDHPHVWIYEKRDLVTEARYAELMAGATTQQVSPTRQAPEPSILLETPVGELPIVDDARWSASLTHNSLAAVFIWIALLFILQLAGWPIAVLLMGRFVDGGWGFARLITILVAGYIVWIGASLEVIQFRAIWAWIAIIAVSSLGWVLFWRDRGRTWGDSQNRRGLRVAFIGELVFWGIFGLFLFYRYLNPDSWHPTWGGEKPMEFAHLNAILRSAHFPPFDPWYSGGYINYYYYGIYLVAFCLKLTGIPSEIAFNLAQPTIMGLLASGGYSLSATLANHMSLRRGFAVLGGLLGVIFLSLLGNLDSFTKLLTKSPGPIADPFGFWTWSGSRTISGAITEFPYFTGLYADLHAHVVALPVTVLALALAYSLATGAREIALVFSRPLRVPAEIVRVVGRLLLLALTLGSLSVSNIWDAPTYFAVSGSALLIGTRQIRSLLVRVALTGALTIALGLAAYVLFFPFFQHFVTLFGSLGRVREPTSFWEFSNHLGGLIAVVVLGLIVETLSTGVSPRLIRQPLVPLALLGFILAVRLLQIEGPSALDGVLAAAVVALVTFVLYAATWTTPSRSLDFGVTLPAGRLLITIGFALAVICVALGQTTLAILLALALSAGWVSLQNSTVAARFVAVMVAAAAFVGAGVELVFLADNLVGTTAYRMNTVFKFYNQIWVMLALTAAVLLTRMVAQADIDPRRWRTMLFRNDAALAFAQTADALRPSRQGLELSEHERSESPILEVGLIPLGQAAAATAWSRAGLAVGVIVILVSTAYPLKATEPRLVQRFTVELGSDTLNATDWMRYGLLNNGQDETIFFRGDRAAIAWFNSEVAGSPVIAEASIGAYRGNGSRISIATGLPTVLGWDNHESQQRYSPGIEVRRADVRLLYDSPDPAVKRAIIDSYDIEYIVVGDVERKSLTDGGTERYASPEGLEAFAPMVGTSFEISFEEEGTIVYQVQSLLSEPQDPAA